MLEDVIEGLAEVETESSEDEEEDIGEMTYKQKKVPGQGLLINSTSKVKDEDKSLKGISFTKVYSPWFTISSM